MQSMNVGQRQSLQMNDMPSRNVMQPPGSLAMEEGTLARSPTFLLSQKAVRNQFNIIVGIAAVAFIIQTFLQGTIARNTGRAADYLIGFAPSPANAPTESGVPCVFVPPFGATEEEFDARRLTLEMKDQYFTMHFDPQNSSAAFIELTAEAAQKGVTFAVTAVEIGGGFSHFQATSGAGHEWMLKVAQDNRTVELLRIDLTTRVPSGDDYEKMWEDSRYPGLRFSLPIATAYHESGTCRPKYYVIDASAFLQRGAQLFGAIKTLSESAVATIVSSGAKRFDRNIDVTVQYMSPGDWAAEESIRFCFFRLPEQRMLGRRADPRAGYFFSEFRLLGDFSAQQAWPGVGSDDMYSPQIRLINRMRVPNSHCSLELNRDPLKLHFYVDPTTPKALWPATKLGIEMWGDAFRGAGHDVQAWTADMPDWPKNYDHADICFNTISWATGGGSTFAIGQSVKDPRSGEVLKANIIFTLGWLRIWMGRRIVYGATAASAELGQDLRRLSEDNSLEGNDEDWRDELRSNASIPEEWAGPTPQLWSLMNNPSNAEAFAFLEKGITDVTAHEVGHTIGLRHNFKGSTQMSWEDCQRKTLVDVQGLSSSVMDYTAFNVMSSKTRTALQAKHADIPEAKDAPFFTAVVGKYDKWVIKYGYSILPEETSENACPNDICVGRGLQTILEAYEVENLEFATDDTRDAFDPYAVLRDIGSNPIDGYEEMFNVAEEGFENMFQRNMDQNKPWTELYTPYRNYRGAVHSSAKALCRFIGGVKTQRKHGKTDGCNTDGSGCTKKSNAPAPEVDQDRALQLILNSIIDPRYNPPAWYFNEAVREVDDGYPSIFSVVPVRVVDEINALKISTLQDLLSADRLKFVRLSEKFFGVPDGTRVAFILKQCSDRLLLAGGQLSAVQIKSVLEGSRDLHDVRAAYFTLMTGYSGSDQVVQAVIRNEASRIQPVLQAVIDLIEGEATSGTVESWFLKAPVSSLGSAMAR